jgi:hypothetical protein
MAMGVLGCGSLVRANTTYSADYYLTTPEAYEGQMVTLDVMGVRPVNFKSPVPELAFFIMQTWDRTKNMPGGDIMLIAPSADARTIMKKYGSKIPGPGPGMRPGMSTANTEKMKGVFTLSPGGKPHHEGEKPGTGVADKGEKSETAGSDAKPSAENGQGPNGFHPEPGMRHEEHGPHGPAHPQMWMIDFEGKCKAIMEAHREEMKNMRDEEMKEGAQQKGGDKQ